MRRKTPAFVPLALLFAAACSETTSTPVESQPTRPDLPTTVAAAITVKPSVTGATVDTDKEDYFPGETVIMMGAGWAPGEVVHLNLVEEPVADGAHDWDVMADADGKFTDTSFAPGVQHLGVTFTLTATGATSGTSVAVFTDGNVVAATTPQVMASNCTTSKTTFAAGEAVCASTIITVAVPPAGDGDFRFQWVTPSGTISREIEKAGGNNSTHTDTFTPTASGTWMVRICKPSGNCASGGNLLASSTFTVLPAVSNTPPSVSITGVTNDASYEINTVPVATCSVTDTEDGPSSSPATLSPITGSHAAFGIGSQTASCSYTDAGGLGATASVTYNIVDTVAPVILFVSRTPSANAAGWNNGDVTVTWSCSDAATGEVAPTVSEDVTGEGAALSVTGTCIDNAGLTSSDTQTGIRIDRTAPSVSAGLVPPANANGWHNQVVTVTFSGSDALSGIESCTSPASIGEGTNQSATGSCTDLAGNEASTTVAGINVDATKPVINGSRTPAANGEGWSNTDVVVAFTCTDALAGVDVNTVAGATLSAEGADQSVTNTGTCTDKAGNTADAATVYGISIDKTAPTLSGAPTTTPNTAGWYKANVTVEWTCGDALSGVVSCPADSVVTGEGLNQSASAMVNDRAGNSQSAIIDGLNIDKTNPVVSVTGVANGATYVLGAVPVAACSTTDALSGVAVYASPSSSGGPVGSITTTCSGAMDSAGNAGNTAIATYSVVYAWAGFFQPVENPSAWNSAKAGQSIPVKFSLGGDQGLGVIAAGHPKVVAITCPSSSTTTEAIEEYVTSTTNNGLVYDPLTGQYNYVWKTEKTWAGKCFRLDVKLVDNTPHSAQFKFVK